MDSTVFRVPASHSLRRGQRSARELRFQDRPGAPAERYVLDGLIAERDRLREHLENVRELANRMIARSDAKEDRISALEAALRQKDALIRDLEQENLSLIAHVSSRESRIAALESFLEMIAEADKRL